MEGLRVFGDPMSLNSIIGWLKPRELIFFDMLEASVGNLLEASRLFEKEFLSREHSSQWSDLRRRMKDLEHVGDEITHNIVDRLNRTFVTPLEREDILALAHALDDVVDCLDGVCERLVLYKVTAVMPLAAQLAHLVVLGSEELVPLIHSLRNMSNTMAINSQIQACMELENQADVVFHHALAEIFEDPKDPIELIKWKEILALLEDATDRIELVSKVVSSTVMRNA
jgi:predicted phosphate transport protein (TIGR00153 family)